MYLQHQPPQQLQPLEVPVCKLKYFTSGDGKGPLLHNDDSNSESSSTQLPRVQRPEVSNRRLKSTKSFLDNDERTFANIRNRLSSLSLSTSYRKPHESTFSDRSIPPRRITSISSRDLNERNSQLGKPPRLHSRTSFLSDDKEFREARRSTSSTQRTRASETAALNKLNENLLTQRQNPELFSRQIKIKDSGDNESQRSSSPRSVKSVESSGKIHFGLIESLDLNEKLNDVEKIKERYSNDEFMNSLTLYKLRGHDRCWHPSGMSEHIPRGTRLDGHETFERPINRMPYSWDSGYAINSIESPRASLPVYVPTTKWEPDKSHVNNQIEAKPKTPVQRKKNVAFHAKHQEITEDELISNPPTSPTRDNRELKSILKRVNSEHNARTNKELESDEFLANETYRWNLQLPKIRSPVTTLRKPPLPFKRKMYQYGNGISREFEQVISRYGNCRQSSIIRDLSLTKDHSLTRDTAQHV
ncbi:hypothetical protein DPMN_026876 [Dreissena polymorpha]|uniref:Uncharacterized protein n=1 Tax=Dreissena polymorpha TaxID=45954 RepID=A0A9D4LTR6_DREPO|nr:hypothetical protein DPMN_026876 [Dreissena polymorpha]